MFVTIAAVLCHLSNPTLCVEEVITDSNMDDTLTMQSCMIGMPAVVKWMQGHPVYGHGYSLQRWKCTAGNKPPPPPAGRA